MALVSIDPSSGAILGERTESTDSDVERALATAAATFATWSRRPIEERAALLERTGDTILRQTDAWAHLITSEMGKPVGEARAELTKCARTCHHFARIGPTYLASENPLDRPYLGRVEFSPLGPLLAIMPWNFPFWQVVRFAAPALLAGNVALLKHASNVSGCALAIEEMWRAAGLPEGVFRTLLLSGARAEELIDDPRIVAATLTGSEATGQRVAHRAGAALKKTVLELGGSDAFIVLRDADVAQAVAAGVHARFQNCGQSCVAAKRFLVEAPVAAEFLERFVAEVRRLRVGEPRQSDTQIGPLARADLREALHRQVERTVADGANVVVGGAPLDRPGFYYAPTVLYGVRPGMAAFDEETFGPVAAVTMVSSEQQAVTLANATRYGLGAALWTRDVERARHLAPRLQAGTIAINGIVASDPRLPFGGIKASGWGRELAHFGAREFTNVQTLTIGALPVRNPSE